MTTKLRSPTLLPTPSNAAIAAFVALCASTFAGASGLAFEPLFEASFRPCSAVSIALGLPATCVAFGDVVPLFDPVPLGHGLEGEENVEASSIGSGGCDRLELRTNSTGSSFSSLQTACLREAQVFWELLGDEGASASLCARPSCYAPAALERSWRPRQASFFAGVERLLPWLSSLNLSSSTSSTSSSSRKGYRRAPGVPPHNVFECQALLEDLPVADASPGDPDPPWPEALQCAPGATVYPISFGVPLEDIVECVPKKNRAWASLIPGDHSTYIFPMTSIGELEYKRMYRRASYADCPRKVGWESMRMYEILASGTVPYISNISQTSPGKLAFLPKRLLLELMNLPGVSRENLEIDESMFDKERYNKLAALLLRHTRERLSTVAVARYILRILDRPNLGKVLYIGYCGHGDFQCQLTLHGLRSILGSNLVDVPLLPYMYHPEDGPPMEELPKKFPCPMFLCTTVTGSHKGAIIAGRGSPTPIYGGGFTYAFRMEADPGVNRSRILERVKAHEFDVLIFGNIEELAMPPAAVREAPDRASRLVRAIWALALERYAKEDLVVIDGADPPPPWQPELFPWVLPLARRTTYFLREIPESCSR